MRADPPHNTERTKETAGRRNVALLSACQAILVAATSILVTLNGLAGRILAPTTGLATLPVTMVVVGGAATTYLASLMMRRTGRRAGFTAGGLIGVAGALICSSALAFHSFVALCLGSALIGAHNAVGGYYRFAAAETVSADRRSRAISYVLAGGLVGGFVGPASTNVTVHLISTDYLASYLSIVAFLVVLLLFVRALRLAPPDVVKVTLPARSLGHIVTQPIFVVAALASSLGYGVMNLLMTATPLAMHACGHPYQATTTVISSHIVAMFAPSFVTGWLIKRFGVMKILFVGVALNIACIGIAAVGLGVSHFWWSLVLLGVGWNFLHVGGTTLLTDTTRPEDAAKAQGANDLLIFVVMAVASLIAGAVQEQQGWHAVGRLALMPMAVVAALLLWLAVRRK